jgi:hypothetical protein
MQKQDRRYFKLTIGNDSMHEVGNDNEFRAVKLPHQKICQRVQCYHTATFIDKFGLLLMGNK